MKEEKWKLFKIVGSLNVSATFIYFFFQHLYLVCGYGFGIPKTKQTSQRFTKIKIWNHLFATKLFYLYWIALDKKKYHNENQIGYFERNL